MSPLNGVLVETCFWFSLEKGYSKNPNYYFSMVFEFAKTCGFLYLLRDPELEVTHFLN